MKDFKTVDFFKTSRQHAKNMFCFQFQEAADPACAFFLAFFLILFSNPFLEAPLIIIFQQTNKHSALLSSFNG
jgi:hypothetical protein